MTDRPFLIVDVDGVLNVFTGMSDHVEVEDKFIAQSFNIYVPKGTRGFLQRLEAAFECVWGTTWEKKAGRLLSPHLGFGKDWDVITFGFDRHRGYNTTWKLPAVKRFANGIAKDRKLAWIDDDLLPDAFEWADSRDDTLLVPTRYEIGITEEHVRRLEEFAHG